MKLSDKAKSIISAVAPTIGAALGGPFGGLAGNVLASFVGGADLEKAVLAGDPATFANLKKAEQDFLIQMRELDIKEEDLHNKDRDSARQREATVKDNMPAILGGIAVGGFFAVVYSVLSGTATVDSVLAGTIIGYVSAKADQVLSYYFGTTHSSSKKNDVIKTMAEK